MWLLITLQLGGHHTYLASLKPPLNRTTCSLSLLLTFFPRTPPGRSLIALDNVKGASWLVSTPFSLMKYLFSHPLPRLYRRADYQRPLVPSLTQEEHAVHSSVQACWDKFQPQRIRLMAAWLLPTLGLHQKCAVPWHLVLTWAYAPSCPFFELLLHKNVSSLPILLFVSFYFSHPMMRDATSPRQ